MNLKRHFMRRNLIIYISIVLAIALELNSYGQTYQIEFGDTINRIDENGMKQGLWIEKEQDFFWRGYYVNNLKLGTWTQYNKAADVTNQYYYSRDGVPQKGIEHNETPELAQTRKLNKLDHILDSKFNHPADSNIHAKLFVLDMKGILPPKSLQGKKFKKIRRLSAADSGFTYLPVKDPGPEDRIFELLDGVKFNIIELQPDWKSKNIAELIYKEKVNCHFINEVLEPRKNDIFSNNISYLFDFKPNKIYLIIYTKELYLTRSIFFNTTLKSGGRQLHEIEFLLDLDNRFINPNEPNIASYPNVYYRLDEFGLLERDSDYFAIGEIMMNHKDMAYKKASVIRLEDEVNEQVMRLRENQLKLENEKKLKEEELKRIEAENKQREIELTLLEKEKKLSVAELEAKKAELLKNQLLASEKKKEIELLSQQQTINELELKNKEAELKQKDIEAANKQQEIAGLQLEKELSDRKAEQQKFIRNLVVAGSGLLSLFLVFVFISLAKSKRANKTIALQKAEVEVQKQRSDELLLNILPEQVAEELKSRGETEAKLIDNVTVLFTDFKGFTQLSEKLSPQLLVSQIHEYFSAFDSISMKHGIEKIKTIGDAYMAAGGLPIPNETHAFDVIRAAIEINEYMQAQQKIKQANGESFFEIRIGVHTGPVVAGIVGVKKFQYDIWGDTVNTASRMESSGEAGKINISETTYALIKDQYSCEYRGEIDAKGKGKMKMYFLQG